MLKPAKFAYVLVVPISLAVAYYLGLRNGSPAETGRGQALGVARVNAEEPVGGTNKEPKAQPAEKTDKKLLGALAGFGPTPSVKNFMQYFPNSETLGKDEMRVTFMGSAPLPRKNQSGMSIFVELGNGDSFIFDCGPGCIKNYQGMGVPYSKINNIFLTHLHVDHWNDLPYIYMFGASFGRWDPLRLYGPSSTDPRRGTAEFAKNLKAITGWHEASFGQFPYGAGYQLDVHELDWKQNPGVAYSKNGVRIIHWPASHTVDGAVSYRLDWNSLSFVSTGDGRPTNFTLKHAAGCDMLVSECQPEAIDLLSRVYSYPPTVMRLTLDMAHTPAYAAGYIFSKTKPRVGVISHISYDHILLAETIDQIRTHWKGPLGLGTPDLVVFNLTKDSVWQREGVIPEAANVGTPQLTKQDLEKLRHPRYQRKDVLEKWVIEAEIPPELYYPKDRMPKVLTDTPEEFMKLPKEK